MTKKTRKTPKHPILRIIETNHKRSKNTLIQLNTTQITLEPTDEAIIKDNYLIIGDDEGIETVINTKHIIYIS